MIRTKCLVCGSEKLKQILDLGIQPFADTFIPKDKVDQSEPTYPLICDICEDCGHVQTKIKTNPDERYSILNDYSYTSSNSKFAIDHWENHAQEVPKKINLNPNSFVVEIGSNDGFLTEQYLKQEHKALGVDPSKYMANLAESRGVKTIVELFNSETTKKIIQQEGKADLVIANNVFNHSEDPLDFAKAVESLLNDKGVFVFEQPYWLTSVETKKFDQIYHEHVSYFSVKSAKELLQLAGLSILSSEVVDYHGGSLRIYAKKSKELEQEPQEVQEMINAEESAGLFNPKTYESFMSEINSKKHQFLQKIHELKSKKNVIIAVGAPAKGNTFLNFHNLDNSVIDYVTDSSPHKQGKFTPLTRIPIVDDNIFADYKEPYALVLSWNLAHKLKPILENINPNIKFIAPED